MFNINPLDVLGQRQLKTMPPHFVKAKVTDANYIDDNVKNWITTKLKNRFCLVRMPNVQSDGKFQSSFIVGFEDPKELTYFMLACPHLRRN